jgi:transposase
MIKGRKRHILTDRPDIARGFVLLPRRWLVERTFAPAEPQPPPAQG